MTSTSLPFACDVREAGRPDIEALLEMIAALSRHHGDDARQSRTTLDADVFGPDPWMRVLVAQCGDTLVGYVGLLKLYRGQDAERGMDMHHLFVRRDQRGRGIGKALVDAACREARVHGCAFITVGTHPDNHEAQAFYKAQGFLPREPYGPKFSRRLG